MNFVFSAFKGSNFSLFFKRFELWGASVFKGSSGFDSLEYQVAFFFPLFLASDFCTHPSLLYPSTMTSSP